ncbi:uncharacterized protein LOC106168519 [Lingula anatina]|uniref:Uncharacterized protein LOC106168519 n=1 Tax=Lingula anatina TaxID=7574 RepID=A0A1S3IYK2_LINAN|nr:uncharacterized protein LOC106168519 [Lingula anatina]|eukprot:XP_013403066.1 uncharacterized protein LOC106168519 [Lingula anatina]
MDSKESDEEALFTYGAERRDRLICCGTLLVRRWGPLERKEKAFVIVSTFGLVAALGFVIYGLATLNGDDWTFALLLLFNIFFCGWYALNGVLREKPYEVAIFCGANILLLAYVSTNFGLKFTQMVNAPDRTLFIVKLARLIVTVVFSAVTLGLGMWVTHEYYDHGDFIFRTVKSAQTEVVHATKLVFLFEPALTVDMQMALSVCVLLLRRGYNSEVGGTVGIVVGFALTVALRILTYFAVQRKSRSLAWLVLVLLLLIEPAFIIYDFIKVGNEFLSTATFELEIVTLTCCTLAVLARAVVIVLGVLVYKAINRREGLHGEIQKSRDPAAPGQETKEYGSMQPEWTK